MERLVPSPCLVNWVLLVLVLLVPLVQLLLKALRGVLEVGVEDKAAPRGERQWHSMARGSFFWFGGWGPVFG